MSIAKSKQVYQYDADHKLIKIYPSIYSTQKNGFNTGNISKCCSSKRHMHKGFVWSFTEITEPPVPKAPPKGPYVKKGYPQREIIPFVRIDPLDRKLAELNVQYEDVRMG
jgi:hypothetical protein